MNLDGLRSLGIVASVLWLILSAACEQRPDAGPQEPDVWGRVEERREARPTTPSTTPPGEPSTPPTASLRQPPTPEPSSGLEQGKTKQHAPATTAGPLSTAQLRTFARVRKAVKEVNDEYTVKIAAADNPHQADALRRQATDAMVERMEAQGMSAEQYSAMASLVQRDPQLQRLVREHAKQPGE